jgi:hypothetical protein
MKHFLPSLLFVVFPAFMQAQTFAPPVIIEIGRGSKISSVAVADINGDGKQDFITANSAVNYVYTMLGNGDGTIRYGNSYPTGSGTTPGAVAVADVNGDSKLDILTSNKGNETIGVLLGNGNGTFQNITTYASEVVSNVTVTDVNGDNRLDIVTTNYNLALIGVMLGNGNGTFGAVTKISTGAPGDSAPADVAVADLNGDGKPDIVYVDDQNNRAGVLLGNGNGTFQAITKYLSGFGATGVSIADVNGDNVPDLVTTNYVDGEVGVLLGNGNGTFRAITKFSVGSYGNYDVEVADVNGDNKPDILTTNWNKSTVAVLLGNGNGTFKPMATFTTGDRSYPGAFVVTDVNGDRRPDIITANGDAYQDATFSVLLNQTPVVTAVAAPLLQLQPTLFPNPTSGEAVLTATGLPDKVHRLQVSMCDAVGHIRSTSSVTVSGGSVRATMLTAGLGTGLYLVRLTAYNAEGGIIAVLPSQRLIVR